MEKKNVKIPNQIIEQLIRTENAIILSVLTKNSSDSIKESARRTLEPTKDDIEVTRNFFQELADVYAPQLLQGKNATLWLCGGFWAANLSGKCLTVMALADGGGKK